MTGSIKKLWQQYENWLNEEKMLSEESFNEAAPNNEIEELTEAVGLLGDDFKELYSIHNGETSGEGMFFGFEFLSISGIIDEINSMVPDNSYQGTSNPEGAIKVSYYETGWVPLGADGSGNFIGIDYNPDVNGKSGQIINFGVDENDKYVLADSIEEFFSLLINEINNDNIKNSEGRLEFHSCNGQVYYHLTDFMVNLKYEM